VRGLLVAIVVVAAAAAGTGCKAKADCRALQEAVRRGEPSRIEELVERGVPVDCTDALGHTGLHIAAIEEKHESASALLARGASLERSDGEQRTPLCEAAKHDCSEVARVLLSSGANKEAPCRRVGLTPLHIAAGADSVDVVKLLLANGAKVNARNGWDQTPMHQLAWEAPSGVEVARLLIAAGAELEIHDNHGFTPLITAAKHGKLAVVQVLLDSGANPNAATDSGHTVMDHGAKFPEVVALVKARGGRAKAPSVGATTPRIE